MLKINIIVKLILEKDINELESVGTMAGKRICSEK